MKNNLVNIMISISTSIFAFTLISSCAPSAKSALDVSSTAINCWGTVQNPTRVSLSLPSNETIQLSGINTSTPVLQGQTSTTVCNVANVSSYSSYNTVKQYLTGLQICISSTGNKGDEISTDVGGNPNASDANVKPNGANYAQFKAALGQLMTEGKTNGDCF